MSGGKHYRTHGPCCGKCPETGKKEEYECTWPCEEHGPFPTPWTMGVTYENGNVINTSLLRYAAPHETERCQIKITLEELLERIPK